MGEVICAKFRCASAHSLAKEFERCSLAWAHPEKRRATRAAFVRKTVRRPSAFELGQMMMAEDAAKLERKKARKQQKLGQKKPTRKKGEGANPTRIRKKQIPSDGAMETVASRRLMV